MMTTLEEIVAYKKLELAEAKRARPASLLEKEIKNRSPRRDFRRAISGKGKIHLIAEIKRASPSAGMMRPNSDAVATAKTYVQAGAHALSILTDSKFFAGSLADLSAVREVVSVPLLRKDFTLEEYHLLEASAAGADAVLLIVAILPRPVLKRLTELARDLSLTTLVEVHTEQELGEALETGAEMIGINNRNLATLQVDLETTQALARLIPKEELGRRTLVAESGIHSRDDLEFVQAQGVDAVLIGEELMKAEDPAKRIKELMGW